MYILEGTMGAGKSTFLTLISQHLSYTTVSLEPVDNWQKSVRGQSLLANFYQDPTRWAYTLETLAMNNRVKEHIMDQSCNNPFKIVERSIYSGHYCFAKNGYENGFMNSVEWTAYDAWFNFLIPGRCKPPRGFIYLEVSPEVAYERIKKRNRLAEQKLSMQYLKQISEKHREFLIEKKDVLAEIANVPVLIINCDKEFETDAEQLNKHLASVENFLLQTSAEPLPATSSNIIQY